jgi:hypothetical protein
METPFDLPKETAMKAYSNLDRPSVTEQLLYAILAQLDKISHQLSGELGTKKSGR